MALIYFRIKAKIPVLLMGETGIGKTALIELLAYIMGVRFEVMKVHAGIS